MFDNYIFDLYGTLVDIRTNERKASLWKNLSVYMRLQQADYTPAQLRRAYHETIASLNTCDEPDLTEVDFSEAIRKLYAAKSVTASPDMIVHWALIFRALSTDYLCLFEDASQVLKQLHEQGKKVYLLSNAQRLFTEPEMKALGIYELFDDIFYSSDIGFVKPSPKFYASLLTKHKMAPADTVMVGNDWQADAWGAYHMGLHSIYIHTAQSSEIMGQLPPDCRRIQKLSELLE